MAEIKLLYKISIRRNNGREETWPEKESRSFVYNFLKMLEMFIRTTGLALTDIDNVSRTINTSSLRYLLLHAYSAAPGVIPVDKQNIVIGSSNTPPTNTDIKLGTRISHGTGSGQLQYGTEVWTGAAIVGDNVDSTNQRTFTNSSGGNVTVQEIGIYAEGETPTQYAFCIAHDLITSVTLANGEALTVTYTLRTTV